MFSKCFGVLHRQHQRMSLRLFTHRGEYILAKVGGVGGIRSDADKMTQTFRTEKSVVSLPEELMSTGECFAWALIKTISDKGGSMIRSKMVLPVGWSTRKPMMPGRHQCIVGGGLDFMSLC